MTYVVGSARLTRFANGQAYLVAGAGDDAWRIALLGLKSLSLGDSPTRFYNASLPSWSPRSSTLARS